MTTFPSANIVFPGYITTLSTLAELRTYPITALAADAAVIVGGQASVSDGLGGVYFWSPASTAADDNLKVIASAYSTVGRWLIAVGSSLSQTNEDAILSSELAAAGGAGMVGYQAVSAGVTRTVAAKLGDLVSVADYMVHDPAGTAVAANTAAFNGLIASASGKHRIHWPAGFSAVLAPIVLRVPTHFVIDGTWILAPNSNANLLDLQSSNCVIEGAGTLDANKGAQNLVPGQAGGVICSNCNVTTGAGVTPPMPLPPATPIPISNIRIRGVTLTNAWNWPVSLGYVSDLEVTGTTLSNSGNSPQFFTNTNGYKFVGNTVHDCTDGGFVVYHGNSNAVISDNHVYNCNDGIGIYNELGSLPQNSYVMISNNLIHDIMDGGIGITTGTAPSGQFNVLVHNNMLYRCNARGGVGKGAIGVVGAQGVSIRGNYIEGDGYSSPAGNQTYSIYANEQVDTLEIVGNMIGNVGSANAAGTCIYLSNPTRCVVSDNTFFDNQAAASTGAGISGGIGAGSVIGNNRVVGTLAGAMDQMFKPVGTSISGAPSHTGATRFTSLEVVDPNYPNLDNPVIEAVTGTPPAGAYTWGSIIIQRDNTSDFGGLYMGAGGGVVPILTGMSLDSDYTTTTATAGGSLLVQTSSGTYRIPVEKVS